MGLIYINIIFYDHANGERQIITVHVFILTPRVIFLHCARLLTQTFRAGCPDTYVRVDTYIYIFIHDYFH